jgi:hypothetical protein
MPVFLPLQVSLLAGSAFGFRCTSPRSSLSFVPLSRSLAAILTIRVKFWQMARTLPMKTKNLISRMRELTRPTVYGQDPPDI